MQPSTLNKPVMDVAAPAKIPVPVPPTPPQAPVASAGDLAVHQAPSSVAPMPAAQPPQVPGPLPAARPEAHKAAPTAPRQKSRVPVALITVTVFVMLVLSVIAIAIYMTSQTA
jgi:hypothetical protein